MLNICYSFKEVHENLSVNIDGAKYLLCKKNEKADFNVDDCNIVIKKAYVKNTFYNWLLVFLLSILQIVCTIFGSVPSFTVGEISEENQNLYPTFFIKAGKNCNIRIFKENELIFVFAQNIKDISVKIYKTPFYFIISVVVAIALGALAFMIFTPIFLPQTSKAMVFSVGGILFAAGVFALAMFLKRFVKINKYWYKFYKQKLGNVEFEKE